jgi:hypothetical protein
MDTNLIVSIAGIIISALVAWGFGDLAAVRASRKLHEEDARKARLMALRSLLNEVERIEKVAKHNSLELKPGQFAQSVTKMPVAAFETAFVCGKPTISSDSELLKAVTDYLARADSINSLVDIYISGVGGTEAGARGRRATVETIQEYCGEDLSKILSSLREFLQRSLKEHHLGESNA